MPLCSFEIKFQIQIIYIICSKHRIQWWHYAISTKSVTIYRSNRSHYRNSWIINEVIIPDDIITIQIFIVYDLSIKIFLLTNDSLFCWVCKWLWKFIVFILLWYLIGNLFQLTLFPSKNLLFFKTILLTMMKSDERIQRLKILPDFFLLFNILW